MSTAIILGPVFFTLLKNALVHGKKAGIATATGIVVSDVLVLLICLSVATQVIQDWFYSEYAYLVAGIVLGLLGLTFLVKKINLQQLRDIRSRRVMSKAFVQGFLINFLNPFVFAIWLGFISIGQAKYSSDSAFWSYAIGILLGVYLTDLLKALFANRIKAVLQHKQIQVIYKVIGVILLLFSVRLLVLSYLH